MTSRANHRTPLAVLPPEDSLMDIEAGLLADIRENRADLTPRLVYADWLDENAGRGDNRADRAALIRGQIDLARHWPDYGGVRLCSNGTCSTPWPWANGWR